MRDFVKEGSTITFSIIYGCLFKVNISTFNIVTFSHFSSEVVQKRLLSRGGDTASLRLYERGISSN